MRLSLLPVLVLLPAALAAQQPGRGAPAAVAGCYTLTPGPWAPALPAAAAYTLPARVVLDTVPAEEVRGSFRVLPAPGAGGGHESATWSPLPFRPDSLRVRWTTGGAGVDARLQAAPGELRGRAVAFDTAGAERAVATLVARRDGGCGAGAAGATELGGLEARGVPEARAPEALPQTPEAPAVEPGRVPAAPPPPPGLLEQVAGYTVGAAILWVVLNFVNVL